jgi:hypothetical protein
MSRSLTWMHLWINKRYVGKARQGLSGGGSGRNKATRGAYEEGMMKSERKDLVIETSWRVTNKV